MAELPVAPPSRATIGQWTMDRYIGLLRWPVLAVAIVTLLVVMTDQPRLLVFFIELAACGWVAWLILHHGGRQTESLSSGAGLGLALGLATSLGHFVLRPGFLSILNGLSEILVTTILAAILTAAARSLLSLFRQPQH